MEREYVGIDVHCRRSVVYRMDRVGERLDCVRVANEAGTFAEAVSAAPVGSDVIIEATRAGTGQRICLPSSAIGCIWPIRTATTGVTGG